MVIAGWLCRHQQAVIEYLKEENRVLREKLGKKRVLSCMNARPNTETSMRKDLQTYAGIGLTA